jgi:cytochrome P450
VPSSQRFPVGASVTLRQLDEDPHPLLARLRSSEPVSWVPVLDGWLVTRYDLAVQVMRDPATFTVDDPRFSTSRVIGPSMLSLDGPEHARHREPFVGPFRPGAMRERFEHAIAELADDLISRLAPSGAAELRRAFAGPIAASIVARALGLDQAEVPSALSWYERIVAAVTSITAGEGAPAEGEAAFRALRARLETAILAPEGSSLLASAAATSTLTPEQIVSNAAVLMFGGIETTEGMLANAVLHLLERPDALAAVRRDPGLLDVAIEESLRLEPAAAVVDRYATTAADLGGVSIAAGELVRVSIAGANRDPAVFADPDRLELGRAGARRHLAFAHGPHVCVGVHLARLEARCALAVLLRRLPGLRLDPALASPVRGLVFRKPATLNVVW